MSTAARLLYTKEPRTGYVLLFCIVTNTPLQNPPPLRGTPAGSIPL